MAEDSTGRGPQALRPRARILRTLGEELISSETVAVLELVKNAYDADARVVLVRFVGSMEEDKGQIDIVDDGHGMDLAVVQTAWMEPATDSKKKAKYSKYLNRRLLGEKGVGRFASARLARELELVTRPPNAENEVYVFFDWTQFDREDLYLDQVLILAEARKPAEITKGRSLPAKVERSPKDLPRDGTHGTILHMNHLKRSWGDEEINDLRRGLSRLVSPFEANQNFRIFLQLPTDSVGTAQELEPPAIIKYPHYTINGDIHSDGQYSLKIYLHAQGKEETLTGWFVRDKKRMDAAVISIQDKEQLEDSDPITCGAFSFRVLVWDRDQLDNIDQKLGTGIQSIRKDLNSVAGISIYRDGFRVLPYGEPDNDWLRLDIRRVQNPTLRLSNNQLTGYIKIGADANPKLKDQSNREGLDNNSAYSDLQSIILTCLTELEARRYHEKKEDRKPSAIREGGLLDAPDRNRLRQKLNALGPSAATLQLFEETTKRWEDQVVQIREVLARYHSLATLGQLLDKVVHDSRQPLSTIQGQSSLARESILRWLDEKTLNDDCREHLTSLDDRLAKVREAADLINTVIRRIEPLGGRKRGRPTKLYLEEIIRGAFAHFDQEIRTLDVRVTLPADTNLVRVDAAELQEVFINLISNSLYWLAKVPKDRRAILVNCSRPIPGEIEIIFADSGPGVMSEDREAIFEPYFSRKPEGVGLGLVITGEIIRDYYDGTLELMKSGPLKGAVFRIVLRKRV